MFVLVPALAAAEPCGDIAQEGMCVGKELLYCNAGVLQTKECNTCCEWGGNKYKCLEDCAAAGKCVDECLTPEVYGCSLMNTHEWICATGDDGCVKRLFTQCADGEICDESTTHGCTDISNVDLCGPLRGEGICDGYLHKQCVNKKIVTTDCSELGWSCTKSGCTADCPMDCLDGDIGCNSASEAWSCIRDPKTHCWTQAAKKCGTKTCIEGICQFPPPDEGPEDLGPVGAEELEPVQEPDESSGGGCFLSPAKVSSSEASLLLLSTLLGVLFFLPFVQRKTGK
jgi:hypothetical protein